MTDLMEDPTYDFIVVGAGVEGSATALSLVEKTLNSSVAILEQVTILRYVYHTIGRCIC